MFFTARALFIAHPLRGTSPWKSPLRKTQFCTAAIFSTLISILPCSQARVVMPSKFNAQFSISRTGRCVWSLMKTKHWKSVPHARDKKSNYTGQNNDLMPKNDKAPVNLLRKYGLLPDCKTCPRCGTGKLSCLQHRLVGAMARRRCNAAMLQCQRMPDLYQFLTSPSSLCRRQASI